MDTRMVTREVRMAHWAGILRERQESGMSIRAWCMEHGVVEKTYHCWQRKLREVACRELASVASESQTSLAPSGWARLETEKPVVTESGVTIEIGGCRVSAVADTNPELLVKVCRMLKAL